MCYRYLRLELILFDSIFLKKYVDHSKFYGATTYYDATVFTLANSANFLSGIWTATDDGGKNGCYYILQLLAIDLCI